MRSAAWFVIWFAACAPPQDARQATLIQVLTKADEILIRSRPQLASGKFERMALGPFDFYRGSLPLFRADWEAGRISQSGFLAGTPPVLGLGDPHPENFGLLVDRDGVLALEPNDFDSADRLPYLFDVRRLVTGLALGARVSRPDEPTEAITHAAALSYATTLLALAEGASPERVTEARGSVLEDLFRRGRRDLAGREELEQLTRVDGGVRHFLRGAPDEAEPTAVLEDVKPAISDSFAGALVRLGASTRVLDTVRQYGSGVASWPRLRFLLLLDGPTDSPSDDVVVELKELTESALAGWYRPALVASDTPTRVEAALRRGWAVPDADPRWFCTAWQGLPVQVRTESEAHKSVRVDRWVGARGTTEALVSLGTVLGAVLARVHSRSEPEVVAALAVQLRRDPQVFSAEQAAFATQESEQVLADFERFREARERWGPLLGVINDERDRPTSLAAQLFGSAPPIQPAFDGGTP